MSEIPQYHHLEAMRNKVPTILARHRLQKLKGPNENPFNDEELLAGKPILRDAQERDLVIDELARIQEKQDADIVPEPNIGAEMLQELLTDYEHRQNRKSEELV